MQRPLGDAQPLFHAISRAVATMQGRLCITQGLDDLLALAQLGTGTVQTFLVTRFRVQPLQFSADMAQIIFLLPGRAQRFPCIRKSQGGLAHGIVGFDANFCLPIQAAKFIQERAVAARVQQATFVMLTMHLNQGSPQLAQQGGGDGLVINKGPAPAISTDLAAQYQAILDRQILLTQNIPYRMAGRQIERGGGHAPFGPFAHQARPTPAAQGQTQSVQQD